MDRVVANVNGDIILLSDIRSKMAFIRNLQAKAGVRPQPGMTERTVLQTIVDEKVLERYAKEKEIKVEDSEIDKTIEGIKTRNGLDDKAFLAGLEAQGLTLEKFRKTIETQILTQRITGMEVTGVMVTEEDARHYYEKHKREYLKPGRVRASHILLLANESSGASQFQGARKKIDWLKDEILAGADFAEMARKFSQDPSASEGGDLGWFTRGEMLAAFEDVAFSLDAGEVGGPVQTGYGFHLIKVMDKEEAEALPFSELADKITARLKNEAYQKKRMALVDRLRDQAYIEILY